jgi:murein DD-endopeptidase MepM/ murein hydrolase activator NlpD
MRLGAFISAIVAVVVGALLWLKLDWGVPQVSLGAPVEVMGRKTPIDIDVHSGAPGIRSVTVRLRDSGTTHELLHEEVAPTTWRGSGVTEKRVHLEPDLAALQVPEGPATLEVVVDTYAWHPFGHSTGPQLAVPVKVDLYPPQLELLTTQHNARLGGVELAVFRQSEDTAISGVAVGPYFFPSTKGLSADPNVAVAFFAIPQDQTADVRPQLIARDGAGNERQLLLPVLIKPRRFAERALVIDDEFLTRKVPELQSANHLPPTPDLVQGYLQINGDLRKASEAKIRAVTAKSEPHPLWDGPFHRQSNAAPLSAFADRRTYEYKGQTIDRQTHLGYDLASLKNSPVEAAQNGNVVFADNLGIYGNTVILDHGLGIFSLYGHLSTIAVHPGERVTTGQTLGQTGETGLAGGDHLHFSIMLNGVHVDPVEWWDPQWIREHVGAKLAMSTHPAAADQGTGSETVAPSAPKPHPPAHPARKGKKHGRS